MKVAQCDNCNYLLGVVYSWFKVSARIKLLLLIASSSICCGVPLALVYGSPQALITIFHVKFWRQLFRGVYDSLVAGCRDYPELWESCYHVANLHTHVYTDGRTPTGVRLVSLLTSTLAPYPLQSIHLVFIGC